jgi:hypothetical protein
MPVTADQWQFYRTVFTIIMGAVSLVFGLIKNEAAMMTIGAGLIGFSPAAKGP